MNISFGRGILAALFLAAATGAHAGPALEGDYVEARTCSVYTGACHANGEMVTAGREALMAWHVTRTAPGSQMGAGLNAVAVVVGQENLANSAGARESVLYLDARATPAQREVLLSAIRARYGATLGRVTSVKVAPIEFTHSGLEYTVRVPDVAYLRTTRYACDHCVMPHQVWYEPFVPLTSSIVAKAADSEFKGTAELPTSWSRSNENSSFVGEFAL